MSEEERPELTSDRPAEVALTRPNLRWFDRVRKYESLLDGAATCCTLSNGETVRVPPSPGTHRSALKTDWTGSQAMAVMLHAREVCRVTVERPGDCFSTDQHLRLVKHG